MSLLGLLFQDLWILQVLFVWFCLFVCFSLQILILSIPVLNLAQSDVVVSSGCLWCQLNTSRDRV